MNAKRGEAMSTTLTKMLISLLLPFALAHGALGDIDRSFNLPTDYVGSRVVTAFALQPDGKILVASREDFDMHGPLGVPYDTTNAIFRLKVNGSLDVGFKKITLRTDRPTGPPYAGYIALDPEGRFLIGGRFDSVNGVARQNVARFEADGTLDTTFDPNSLSDFDKVSSLALQPDGKIVIASNDSSAAFFSGTYMRRLNPDGTLDVTFGTAIRNYGVGTVMLLADGKLLIGGGFRLVDGTTRSGFARLESDGRLDPSLGDALLRYGPEPGNVTCMAIQPDGKIVIGGEFTSVTGVSRRGIARLNSNGTLDRGFDPGSGVNFQNPNEYWDGRGVFALSLQDDGKVLIAGRFEQFNGLARTNIARLTSDGSVDLSFDAHDAAPSRLVIKVEAQPDGKLLLAGLVRFFGEPASDRPTLVRLNGGSSLPRLTISRSDEHLLLFWPALGTVGAVLEGADPTAAILMWIKEDAIPSTVGDQHVLSIEPAAAGRLYRLRQP
jgi:uncharacterized delta-60 repeat protein